MAKIIDLGNGYARLENYGSPYASLTFPLTLSRVRQLHAENHINDDEAKDALTMIGFEPREAAWFVALDSVDLEEIGRKHYGLGAI